MTSYFHNVFLRTAGSLINSLKLTKPVVVECETNNSNAAQGVSQKDVSITSGAFSDEYERILDTHKQGYLKCFGRLYSNQPISRPQEEGIRRGLANYRVISMPKIGTTSASSSSSSSPLVVPSPSPSSVSEVAVVAAHMVSTISSHVDQESNLSDEYYNMNADEYYINNNVNCTNSDFSRYDSNIHAISGQKRTMKILHATDSFLLDLGAFPDTKKGHFDFGHSLGKAMRDEIHQFVYNDSWYKEAWDFLYPEKEIAKVDEDSTAKVDQDSSQSIEDATSGAEEAASTTEKVTFTTEERTKEQRLESEKKEEARKTKDARLYSRYLRNYNEAKFPMYFEELYGLAHGADVPFERIWIAIAQQELLGMQGTADVGRPRGCSDVIGVRNYRRRNAVRNGGLSNRKLSETKLSSESEIKLSETIICHNEDGSTELLGMGKFVRFGFYKISLSEGEAASKLKTKYVCAFCYPAALPGWGPAFNENGVAYTLNFLFPENKTLAQRIVGDPDNTSPSECAHYLNNLETEEFLEWEHNMLDRNSTKQLRQMCREYGDCDLSFYPMSNEEKKADKDWTDQKEAWDKLVGVENWIHAKAEWDLKHKGIPIEKTSEELWNRMEDNSYDNSSTSVSNNTTRTESVSSVSETTSVNQVPPRKVSPIKEDVNDEPEYEKWSAASLPLFSDGSIPDLKTETIVDPFGSVVALACRECADASSIEEVLDRMVGKGNQRGLSFGQNLNIGSIDTSIDTEAPMAFTAQLGPGNYVNGVLLHDSPTSSFPNSRLDETSMSSSMSQIQSHVCNPQLMESLHHMTTYRMHNGSTTDPSLHFHGNKYNRNTEEWPASTCPGPCRRTKKFSELYERGFNGELYERAPLRGVDDNLNTAVITTMSDLDGDYKIFRVVPDETVSLITVKYNFIHTDGAVADVPSAGSGIGVVPVGVAADGDSVGKKKLIIEAWRHNGGIEEMEGGKDGKPILQKRNPQLIVEVS